MLLARAWEAFWPCSAPASWLRLSVVLPVVALAPAGGRATAVALASANDAPLPSRAPASRVLLRVELRAVGAGVVAAGDTVTARLVLVDGGAVVAAVVGARVVAAGEPVVAGLALVDGGAVLLGGGLGLLLAVGEGVGGAGLAVGLLVVFCDVVGRRAPVIVVLLALLFVFAGEELTILGDNVVPVDRFPFRAVRFWLRAPVAFWAALCSVDASWPWDSWVSLPAVKPAGVSVGAP